MNVEQKRVGVEHELWPRAEWFIPGVLICIQLEAHAVSISNRNNSMPSPRNAPKSCLNPGILSELLLSLAALILHQRELHS